MKRQVSIEEIWDGRFYGPGDMVKAGCGECSAQSPFRRMEERTVVLQGVLSGVLSTALRFFHALA